LTLGKAIYLMGQQNFNGKKRSNSNLTRVPGKLAWGANLLPLYSLGGWKRVILPENLV